MDKDLMIKSIQNLCEQHNISLSDLKEKAELSEEFISWCSTSAPFIYKLFELAEYFNTTIDKVAGREAVVNDEFLDILLYKTDEKLVNWKLEKKFQNTYLLRRSLDGLQLRFDSPIEEIYYNKNRKDIAYYISLDLGYVSIYVEYYELKITTPLRIALFIQPNSKAKAVRQDYTTEQLLPLWLKVLGSFGSQAPDIMRAESMKLNFINSAKNDNNVKGN